MISRKYNYIVDSIINDYIIALGAKGRVFESLIPDKWIHFQGGGNCLESLSNLLDCWFYRTDNLVVTISSGERASA
jgi:hypothetical protein